MHFQPLLTPIILLCGIQLVNADCTSWTQTSTYSDTGNQVSTKFQVAIDNLICPYNSTSDCVLPRKTYNITTLRTLNISASAADTPSIFALISNAWNSTFATDSNKNFTSPFETLSFPVSTSTSKFASIFTASPGKNLTLFWIPYMRSDSGFLGNCTNTTLNGVGVKATAPYTSNGTTLAGQFSSGTSNVTNSTSGAAGLVMGGKGGFAGALMGVVMLVVFVNAL